MRTLIGGVLVVCGLTGPAGAVESYALALIEIGAEIRAVDEMLGIVAEEPGLDDATRAEILVQAGELLIEQDDPVTARLVAEQAVGLGGGQSDALSLRAATKLAADDPEGALTDLNKAVSQGPRHHLVLIRRSAAHRAVGQFIAARDDAVFATEIAPDRASAWLERGRVEARLRDKVSARLSLLKAIELDEQGTITPVAQNVLHRMEADLD
jgi:tetratricopeptide (TPR) repeat protein